MRKALTMLAAVAALAACSSTAEEEQPGNAAVYERIEAATDCAALQQEFDTASATHDSAEDGSEDARAATAYMEAADARMQELDCY